MSTPEVRTTGSRGPTGGQILESSWNLLSRDRQLLWLPVLSFLGSLIAAGVLFGPGWYLGDQAGGAGHHDWSNWVGGAFALFAGSVVTIYFQAALAIGANERADGGAPTLRWTLAQAWQRRGLILSWAVLTTTVGLSLRVLQERFGWLGGLLRFVGSLAWSVMSFLVVPVLVVENIGPRAALRRSTELTRATWGTGLRSSLRLGFTQFLLAFPAGLVMVFGGVLVASGVTVVGLLCIVLGGLGLLGLAMAFSAVDVYARTLIYRYAVGLATPGVDSALFEGAFVGRRSKRMHW